MEALTDRQAEILRFVAAGAAQGLTPTIREIGDQFGIASTNGVNDHLAALVHKGYLIRLPMTARGLLLTDAARRYLSGGDAEVSP